MSRELGSAEPVMDRPAPGTESAATFVARALWPDKCETGDRV
jgi:hypothetical protein